MDLQHLRASDGTGEAVLAHIDSPRNPGSTVLSLDNVDNWNGKALIVTGVPAANGFVSPVGMKVMYGHLNAGDFIIDGFAPGYTDNGNTTQEVAIIKMTTSWADALVDLLKQTLADNGKIKVDGIDNENMFADAVDPVKRASETTFPHTATGGVWTGDSLGASRNASMSAAVVYINGRRLTLPAVVARTFTASKDTYIDVLDNLNGTASLVYTEVNNNAASPALAANSFRMAIITTGASNIAASGNINQGSVLATSPVVSNNTLTVCDTLGNLIGNRTPAPSLIGFRRTSVQAGITGLFAIPGSGMNVQVPAGRNLEYKLYTRTSGTDQSTAVFRIREDTAGNGYEDSLTYAASGRGTSLQFSENRQLSAGTHYFDYTVALVAGAGNVYHEQGWLGIYLV